MSFFSCIATIVYHYSRWATVKGAFMDLIRGVSPVFQSTSRPQKMRRHIRSIVCISSVHLEHSVVVCTVVLKRRKLFKKYGNCRVSVDIGRLGPIKVAQRERTCLTAIVMAFLMTSFFVSFIVQCNKPLKFVALCFVHPTKKIVYFCSLRKFL